MSQSPHHFERILILNPCYGVSKSWSYPRYPHIYPTNVTRLHVEYEENLDSKCTPTFVEGINFGVDPMG